MKVTDLGGDDGDLGRVAVALGGGDGAEVRDEVGEVDGRRVLLRLPVTRGSH